MEKSERESFEVGVRLWNEGEYLEAHEHFEELWMERGGRAADCLKGLIQATVALHHATCANRSGASKLRHSFPTYLRADCHGVLPFAVKPFVAELEACLDAYLEQAKGTWLDETTVPRLVVDWSLSEE